MLILGPTYDRKDATASNSLPSLTVLLTLVTILYHRCLTSLLFSVILCVHIDMSVLPYTDSLVPWAMDAKLLQKTCRLRPILFVYHTIMHSLCKPIPNADFKKRQCTLICAVPSASLIKASSVRHQGLILSASREEMCYPNRTRATDMNWLSLIKSGNA